MRRWSFVLVAIMTATLARPTGLDAQPKPASIQGVWQIVERARTDGTTDTNPPVAIRMFTQSHNCVVMDGTPGAKSCGTYQVQGNEIITHPLTASQQPGSTGSTYEFKVDGDTLLIRQTKPAQGLQTKYRRIE